MNSFMDGDMKKKVESKRTNWVALIQVLNCLDHLTNRAGQIRERVDVFQVVESAGG